jgi:cytochrome c-type biogenesis protein CcmH/NrfG
LISLGKAYAKDGDVSGAINAYKEALLLSNNIEYKHGAEEAQVNIISLQN